MIGVDSRARLSGQTRSESGDAAEMVRRPYSQSDRDGSHRQPVSAGHVQQAAEIVPVGSSGGRQRLRKKAHRECTDRPVERAHQAGGRSLTGNRKLEREGGADRWAGEVEERLTDVTDQTNEMIDKAADAVKGTISASKTKSRRK